MTVAVEHRSMRVDTIPVRTRWSWLRRRRPVRARAQCACGWARDHDSEVAANAAGFAHLTDPTPQPGDVVVYRGRSILEHGTRWLVLAVDRGHDIPLLRLADPVTPALVLTEVPATSVSGTEQILPLCRCGTAPASLHAQGCRPVSAIESQEP